MFFGLNIDAWMQALFTWLAVPQQGLLALAIVAFVAASLVPLSSEAALLAVLAARPDQFWVVILVATAANVAGSLTTYWMGRLGREMPRHPAIERHLHWFERHGTPMLFFAWAPLVGDMLVLLGGWLKLNAWSAAAWISLGKLVRYLALAQGWMWLR